MEWLVCDKMNFLFPSISEYHKVLAKRDGCNGSKYSRFCGRCQGEQPCYGHCVYALRFVTFTQFTPLFYFFSIVLQDDFLGKPQFWLMKLGPNSN